MSHSSDIPYLNGKGLAKHYGESAAGLEALRGIDISADRGEFLAIRGPSGCGKSTLLHILGAMDRPTKGTVHLNGRRLDLLSLNELAVVRRKHIGFIFQAFNLLPTLNVEENVSLPLMLDGVPERESAARSEAAISEVGLGARRQHFPSQLSGGEMQRVAIARAVAIDPELIIADEPTGSLDSVNGRRVLELLAELNQNKKITIVMATHSEEAAAFAVRSIRLRDGLLDEEATSSALSSSV